ncbi:uncharacterized [Tachysurus ichikawai]
MELLPRSLCICLDQTSSFFLRGQRCQCGPLAEPLGLNLTATALHDLKHKKQITHRELASSVSDWPSSPAVLLRLTPSIISPSASSLSLHSDLCQHKRRCSASTGHHETRVKRLIKAPPDSPSSTTFETLNRESHICSMALRAQSLPPLMSSCTSESPRHQRAQFHTQRYWPE